jgi:hypothetical protein
VSSLLFAPFGLQEQDGIFIDFGGLFFGEDKIMFVVDDYFELMRIIVNQLRGQLFFFGERQIQSQDPVSG